MSQLTLAHIEESTRSNESDWDRVARLGGISAWLQFFCLAAMLVIMPLVGPVPETAEATFRILQNHGLAGILRLDLATLVLLALFPVTAVGLYAALRHSRGAYGLLALVLILTGTLLSLANESAFSMMYLSDLHAAASSAVQQEQLIAAGDAILAGNMWNSTAGFLAGVFMQGGFVFISWVMLRDRRFSKFTAYSGILSNGLDLLHVFVMLISPALAGVLLGIGGVSYLVWFPLLGRDLYRSGRARSH